MRKMKKEAIKKSQQEQGAILVVTLLIVVVLMIFALPTLSGLSTQYKRTENTFKSLSAFNFAEAGVDRAIWELNYGDITTWSGDSQSRTLNFDYVEFGDGEITITVENLDSQSPVIESKGRVLNTGSQYVEKTIRVGLSKESGGSPLFDVGVFADEGIEIASNLQIEGDVRTNSTDPGSIVIHSNSQVNGDAICGPGGEPEMAIILEGSAVVAGQKRAAAAIKELPSVIAPEGLPYQGIFYLKNETATISESGEYASFILDSGSQVIISGDVTLHVTGQFTLGNNSVLNIEAEASLTLFLSGSFHMDSNCQVNNILQDPCQFLIFGTDYLTGTVTFDSNNDFYAAVYMPRADLIFSSNINFFGSAIGKSAVLNSNVEVTYDEELGELEGLPVNADANFSVKSWQQK